MTQHDTTPATNTDDWRERAGDRTELSRLLTAAEVATVVAGLDGSLIEANEAARALFVDFRAEGASQAGLAVRDVLERVPRRLFEDFTGGLWAGDVDSETTDGQMATLETTVMVQHQPTAVNGGTVAVMCRPLSSERLRAMELERRLETDPITGLANRSSLIAQAARLVEAGRTNAAESALAVLLVDIDHLRDVNDALGYEIGDRLIASTAKRLATAMRPTDVVGRTGCDEFAVLCPGVADESTANELATRVRNALTGRLTIHGLELDVSVSVGISLSDPRLDEMPAIEAATQLIGRADTAAHAAKRQGRAAHGVFRDELRDEALVRTELATSLSKALRDGELAVEYQPIFSAVSELAEGAEALLRWNHPTRGRIEASDFIPIAEETGVIVPIGDWVLDQACAAARRWIDDELVGPRFAVHVNVSRRQLADPGFVERIVEIIRTHQLRPRQLVLEAREATLLGGADEIIRAVRALRRVGVRIALDNFGTGSNSLSLLTDVGADVLKLDGSLALPSGSSEADTRVARALVLLAHALSMEVVAERVSADEQLRRLRAAGCDLIQGHLVGKPAPPDELPARMSH